ncbi:MAG: hypothetical protein U0361_22935 [Nitrospiraceae bacterium]
MRTILALVLVFLLAPLAGAITVETQVTLQNAAGNATGTAIKTKGFTSATFHVCCTGFNAVVTMKASVDGTNFYPIGCVPIDMQTALVATTTLPGIWRCNLISINAVRADVSNYSAGTITVTVGLTAAGVS